MGGNAGDYAKTAISTPDKGLMILGRTYSYGMGDSDIILCRTDSLGYLVWSKTLGTPYRDVCYSLKHDHDNGYIAICWVNNTDYTSSYDDWYIFRFDLDGNIFAERFFGGDHDDEVHNFCLTSDGGYIFSGGSWSFGMNYSDLWIVKTDHEFNVQWSRTFDSGKGEHSRSITETADGNYFLVGNHLDVGSADQAITLLFLDPDGTPEWSKKIDGPAYDDGRSVIIAPDGNFIVAGMTDGFGADGIDILVFKISPGGDILWAKTYGGPGDESAYAIRSSIPGEYMISGTTDSYGQGSTDALLLNIDEGGNVIGCFTYGGVQEEYQPFIEPSGDGGFLLSGGTYSYGYGDLDMWVVKTGSNGQSCCGTAAPITGKTAGIVASPLNLNMGSGMQSYHRNVVKQDQSPITELICYEPLKLVGDQYLCSGSDTGSYNIIPGPNMHFQWTVPPGATITGTQGDTAISVVFGQEYGNIYVYSQGGCVNGALDSIWVEVSHVSPPDLGPDTSLCGIAPYLLDAGAGYAGYRWQDGSTGQQYLAETGGTYFVEVSDSNGCRASDTLILNMIDVPDIFLGNDTNICGNFALLLEAGEGFDSYLWQDGSDGDEFLASLPGLYWVNCLMEGCTAGDTLIITNDCPSDIWFPNCFTPNDDGVNDLFMPVYENISNYKLYVFNRWGQLIHESVHVEEGWNGRYKGRECPEGVYFFLAEFTEGSKPGNRTVTGSVTLLR